MIGASLLPVDLGPHPPGLMFGLCTVVDHSRRTELPLIQGLPPSLCELWANASE